MNIETINKTLNITELIGNEKKNKMIEGDLNVPDIKPDILSLVSVNSEIFITNQIVTNGKVNIEGVMEVCVIYMSEDENASFKSLNGTFNFVETFNINGANENSIIDVKVYKGPIECKVVNARRVNVKLPITLDVNVLNTSECNIAKDVVNENGLELKKKTIDLNILQGCKSQDIEMQENVSLNEENKAIGEILCTSLKIVNEDYKISYNKILAKADAVLKILYVADDEAQSLETFEATIPVMGFIDYDGISDDMDIKLDYNIKSYFVKPIYQDLKSLSISVESNIAVRVCVYQKETIEIIDDIYSIQQNLNCTYEDITVLKNVINQNDDIEISQGLLIPELENIKILNISAEPNITTINVLDGKVAIEGNINFEILNYNESRKTLENKKMELPFAQVIKVPEIQNGMNVEIDITVQSIDFARIDSSQIQIKLNTRISTSANKNESIRGITSIDTSDNEVDEIPSIIIYYVKSGDTLWNIAKRYKTTVKDIMEYNELKDENIYPNQQLIILKRSPDVAKELL